MDSFKMKDNMDPVRFEMLADHTNDEMEDIDPFLERIKVDLYQRSLHNRMSFTIIDLWHSRFSLNISAFKDCFTFDCIKTDKEENNWNCLYPLIHTDDLNFYCESDVLGYYYLMNLTVEEQKYFQMIYTLRLKNKKHNYKVYLIRIYVLLCDKKDHPRLMIAETIQLPFCNADEFQPYRQYCLVSEKTHEITKHFDAHNSNELTGMEMKVLKLRSANNSINKTAELLHITSKRVQKLSTEIIKRFSTSNMPETSYLASLLRIFFYLLMMCDEGICDL